MTKLFTSVLTLALILLSVKSFAKVDDFQDLIVESNAAKDTLSKSLKNTVERVDRPAKETGDPSVRPAHTFAEEQVEVDQIVVPSAGLDSVSHKSVAKQAARQTETQQKARVSSEITEDDN